MPPDDITVASVATTPSPATPASPVETAPLGSRDVADDITFDSVAAITDEFAYTLTAGQALERFARSGRKVPSLRTIQRYCIEGRLTAQKIRTTYGSEWLINEESLSTLVESEPMIVVVSDAMAQQTASPATPISVPTTILSPVATANDVASDADVQELATPAGERRRLSDVLIENAKLLATVEGRDAVIAELKEDKGFLREELREARRTRDDVKNIAERMLDTLKTMAIGRLAAATPPPEPIRADIINPNSSAG